MTSVGCSVKIGNTPDDIRDIPSVTSAKLASDVMTSADIRTIRGAVLRPARPCGSMFQYMQRIWDAVFDYLWVIPY